MKFGQPVLLGRNCFDQLGRLLHEIGHVLGLVHEHMRPIRDEYVTVKAPITNINFQKVATTEYEDFGITYDFNSVMHYPLLVRI
ncbi:hypothetical protein LSH36_515g02011 [Paralvinella palmiformis]|uniref:Metalloendopeptidase n=1 Tax=Paralvinella palmiformis TaxID=53620 RepID=A0AAD9J7X1_9ANNE|nr:hypothetical protein LSH36_515g02011 [Paralvinella palmiformis]